MLKIQLRITEINYSLTGILIENIFYIVIIFQIFTVYLILCENSLFQSFDWKCMFVPEVVLTENIPSFTFTFSRRFYPKRLTIVFRLYIFISTCDPWESNPQPFALLTQCSTTEPHRNNLCNFLAVMEKCFVVCSVLRCHCECGVESLFICSLQNHA